MSQLEDPKMAPGPPLVGRSVALRPVEAADYDVLYRAEHSEQLGSRWRLQGNTIAPESYAQTLWRGVTAQFAVVESRSPRPIGLVSLYDTDHSDQVAYLAVADLGVGGLPTRVAQGAALFLSYVFGTWPLRKVYVQAMEYNTGQYRSMCGRLLVEEGRLREHHYLGDCYWDEVIYAIYRAAWERWAPRLLAGVLPGSSADAGERDRSHGLPEWLGARA